MIGVPTMVAPLPLSCSCLVVLRNNNDVIAFILMLGDITVREGIIIAVVEVASFSVYFWSI